MIDAEVQVGQSEQAVERPALHDDQARHQVEDDHPGEQRDEDAQRQGVFFLGEFVVAGHGDLRDLAGLINFIICGILNYERHEKTNNSYQT